MSCKLGADIGIRCATFAGHLPGVLPHFCDKVRSVRNTLTPRKLLLSDVKRRQERYKTLLVMLFQDKQCLFQHLAGITVLTRGDLLPDEFFRAR